MINENLLKKIERIHELPVSEEMLGAYIEGNIAQDESKYILDLINQDNNMTNLVDEIENLSIEDSDNNCTDFGNINIPHIDDDALLSQLHSKQDMSISDYDDLSDIKLIFGEEGIEECKNPYINQYYTDTCAIRSQQIILRDYGINISQEDLMKIANANGWYTPGSGTAPEHVGNLLEIAGVSCHRTEGNTILDLTRELAQGHRIIVGVDSGELWADGILSKFAEKMEDSVGILRSDHALIVAGVEVNPMDPHDVKVVLTDPGTGHLRIEYNLDEFMDAWQDSNCFMVATDEPAPYQFNPQNNTEVPSGFQTDFALNQFVTDNNYKLSITDSNSPLEIAEFYSELNPIEFPRIDSLNPDNDMFDFESIF